MPDVMGPVPGPAPPTPHEVKLREAIDRLRLQLDECREEINELAIELAEERILHQRTINHLGAANQVIDLLRPMVEGTPLPDGRATLAAITAYDKLTEETTSHE